MIAKCLRFVLAAIGAVALTLILAVAAAEWLQARREAGGAAAPATGERVEIGDGAIFVQRFGPAGRPAVVVVPGMAWSGFWTSAARALGEAGFSVIAVDLPPFGFSDRPANGDYSRAAQAERLSRLIAALRLDNPVVLAHAFGAGAAVELAMRHCEQVGGLVLVDGAVGLQGEGEARPRDAPWLKETLGRGFIARAAVDAVLVNPLATRWLLAIPRATTPAVVESLQAPYRRPGTSEAYARWLPFLLFSDASAFSVDPARYHGLNLPVALIWGGADAVTPLAQGQRLAHLIRGATLDVLPGLGHVPHVEDERAFVNATVERLRQMNRL